MNILSTRTRIAAAGIAATLAAMFAANHEVAAGEDGNVDRAIAALQSTVGDLQRRIVLLQDTDAIENLVSIYGYYLDKQQWDLLADLFADDATLEISERGVYAGKASIRKALELFGPQNIPPDHLHNHIQLQPVIHIDAGGKTAHVRSRAFSQLGTFQRNGLWMGGVYENVYVKQDGVWKIQKDHVYTTYFTEYDKGWASSGRATAKPSATTPPDRPATEHYDAYPGVYIPAYSYKHPVTGQAIVVPKIEAEAAQ
jgi:ketosteroid isomerase-like protein